MKKRFLSILCVFTLILGTGTVIPISAAESTDVFVDELTDFGKVGLKEGDWQVFSNHSEIGRSVAGRNTTETENNIYYSFSDKYISSISVTVAEYTGFFAVAQVPVAVRTKGSDKWTEVLMTASDETDIAEATTAAFKQIILTASSLPDNVIAVKIGLKNDVNWTLFLDKVSLDLTARSESNFSYITDDFSSSSEYATFTGMGIHENYHDFARNVAWRTVSDSESSVRYKIDGKTINWVSIKADLYTGYGAQNNISLEVRATDNDEWTKVTLKYGDEEIIPEFADSKDKRTLLFTADIALPGITQARISLTNTPWVMVLEKVTLQVENQAVAAVGDLNSDGKVDILDLIRFKRELSISAVLAEKYDLNGDTLKDSSDLALLRKNLLGLADFDSAEVLAMKREIVNYRTFSDEEITQIAITQLSNWAIPVSAKTAEGAASINPYFADYAAMAMLERPELYATNVLYYINWHFDRLNDDGTIYDYNLVNDTEVSTEKYDSTDSYAATFLSLLWKFYGKTGNTEVITENAEKIAKVVSALEATMDNDLTYAKADYKIKYTMDNCEVYVGLSDAAKLYGEVLKDEEKAAALTQKAENVAAAIEAKLWNESGVYYEVGINENGASSSYNAAEYYPSGQAQLFPIITGVLNPASERAQSIWKSFNSSFDVTDLGAADDYYCFAAYAAAIMNDSNTFGKYVTAYKERFGANLRINAYTAFVVMASEVMQKNISAKLS